jgi:hypothetical protein
MVEFGVVVQGERVVARAPAVADPRQAIDHQRIDIEPSQRCREPEPRLTAADDEDGRFAIGVSLRGVTLLLPVRPAEVAGIRLARRPPFADLLLETLQFVERGHQLKGARRFGGEETQHAVPTPDFGFERDDRFDDFVARALYGPWWRAPCRNRERARLGPRLPLDQQGRNVFCTLRGRQTPGERKHIAEMAVRDEQIAVHCCIVARQCGIESFNPGLNADRRIVVRGQPGWILDHIHRLLLCKDGARLRAPIPPRSWKRIRSCRFRH